MTNAGSMAHGSGGGEGKATFHDLSFVHNIDKASPVLMQACATGAHLKEATITHRKAGKEQHEYLDREDERRHRHGRDARRQRRRRTRRTSACRSPRWRWNTSRRRPTGRSTPGIHFKYDLKATEGRLVTEDD